MRGREQFRGYGGRPYTDTRHVCPSGKTFRFRIGLSALAIPRDLSPGAAHLENQMGNMGNLEENPTNPFRTR